MKFKHLLIITSTILSMMLAACNSDNADNKQPEPEPETEDLTQLTLSTTVTHADEKGFYLYFTAGETTKTIDYVVVPFIEEAAALANFDQHEHLKSIQVTSEEQLFECPALGSYVLLARPVSEKGTQGEIIRTTAICGEAGIEVLAYDTIILDYTVRIYNQEKYGYVGVLAVSNEVLPDFGMTLEELIKTYAEIGGFALDPHNTQQFAPLNGEANYSYTLGVALMDPDNQFVEAFGIPFVSAQVQPDLEQPEPMTVTIENIGTTYATITFQMNDNTRAYYRAIMNEEDYLDLISFAATLDDYDNPEDYLRDYISFYTNPLCADEVYKWTNLEPDTRYYALGFPLNANGLAGWGTGTIKDFITQPMSN